MIPARDIRANRRNYKIELSSRSYQNYPWQRLNSDLFEFKGHEYLLLSDQYSKFPAVRKLTSTSSQAIETHLKSIFAEHGIPAQLLTDSGPHYSSKEFKDFTESLPAHYPQANWSSERMVQTVKNILTKCDEEGGDPYLALLSYRATPIDHHLKSPAELLTNGRFRTLLPMSNRASLTPDSGKVKEQLKRQQDRYGHYYNRKAGPTLEPLHPGQPVRIRDHHTKTWKPGTVLRAAKEPRLYVVKNNTTDGVYQRTRSHLRPDTASSCAHSPTQSKYPQQSRDHYHHPGTCSHPQIQTINHQEIAQSPDPLKGLSCTQRQVAGTGPDPGGQ